MSLNRGDVAMSRFPYAGGSRGKKRPVLVVQSDVSNATARHVIVAEITTNLAAASDPTCLLKAVLESGEHVLRTPANTTLENGCRSSHKSYSPSAITWASLSTVSATVRFTHE